MLFKVYNTQKYIDVDIIIRVNALVNSKLNKDVKNTIVSNKLPPPFENKADFLPEIAFQVEWKEKQLESAPPEFRYVFLFLFLSV